MLFSEETPVNFPLDFTTLWGPLWEGREVCTLVLWCSPETKEASPPIFY